jgi:hypothetical protein
MAESDFPLRECVNGESGSLRKSNRARPAILLLLLSVALVMGASLLLRPAAHQSEPLESHASMSQNAADLALLLRHKVPQARIVSTRADGQIDRSFLLTVRETDEEALRRLPRVAERAEQWRGTVLCEWLVNWETADLFLEEWGEFAFALPPFVFFGDKELLERIKKALR